MSLTNRFIFIAAAAVAATMGDLLMLFVVATAQHDAVDVRPPGAALAAGGLLGVLGIPFYWFGYWLISQAMEATHAAAARLVVLSGAMIGSVGTVIHAVTAFAIRFDMISGNPPLPPAEWIASWGTPLLVCWVIAAVAALIAAIAITATALSVDPPIPRILGLLNPVSLTAVLAAAGLGSEMGRAFLVPAAPNIAHACFFFLAAATADSFAKPVKR